MVVAALATTALGRSGAAREVAAAVLVAARTPHVAIDVRIDVGVRVGIDVRIRVHIRVRIEMSIRVDVRVCVDMRIGVDVRVRRSRPAARLVALQRVALISLDVELALRALRRVELALRALRRVELALRALHRTLERAPPALELLAQRRVLESNAAAVSGIEMPIIEAAPLGDEIGAIEPTVIDHIDADRSAAGPTAVPA